MQPIHHRFDFEDYLRVETDSQGVKHEFLAGRVWAMAGGSPDHALIATNIATLLNIRLRGRPCAVFSSDLRIGVQATQLVTYPDVSVICGSLERDPIDRTGQTITNPKVLVEVLSPSTAEYDRGEKIRHYKLIASLEAIVLVAHDARRLELWQRTGDEWRFTESTESVTIDAIECTLAVADVYRDPLGSA
ncbi:MAG: Uma2 family endonuclease [Kofleriaceae bacterium]